MRPATTSAFAAGATLAEVSLGVRPSFTLAQAILESAWGCASIGNNIFGIKANPSWKGAKKLVATTEYINGVKTPTQAYFRDYSTIEYSIADHAKFLTMPRYKAVIAAKDYKEACVSDPKVRYATDSQYSLKLIALIEALDINKRDDVLSTSTVKPQVAVTTYEVKGGDTLSKIAADHKTTVDSLMKLNGIPNANFIRIGQIIRLIKRFKTV